MHTYVYVFKVAPLVYIEIYVCMFVVMQLTDLQSGQHPVVSVHTWRWRQPALNFTDSRKLYKNVLPVALTEYFYWKNWSPKGNLDFKSPPKPQLPSFMILCSIHLTPSGINNAPILLSYYHLTHWYFKHNFTHTGIRDFSTVCLQYNDSIPLDNLVKGIWQKHMHSDLVVKGPHMHVLHSLSSGLH